MTLKVPKNISNVKPLWHTYVVATIVDRTYEAGFHTVEWNGRSSGGQQVASGIYLYRIIAGDFIQTRKMMLLK